MGAWVFVPDTIGGDSDGCIQFRHGAGGISGSNDLKFTTGSTSYLYVTGNVGVKGDLTLSGTLTANRYVVQTIDTSEGSTIFGNDATDTHQFTGSLEALSTTTQQKWSYDADSYATFAVADASHTTIATGETGNLILDAGGHIKIDAAATKEVIFNEAVADVDFRVGGVGQEVALFVQGSDGYVGVGEGNPSKPLHVAGDALLASTSKFYFNDVGGEYISGDGSNLAVSAGTTVALSAPSILSQGIQVISASAGYGLTYYRCGNDTGLGNIIEFQTGSGDGSTHVAAWTQAYLSPAYTGFPQVANSMIWKQSRDKEGVVLNSGAGYLPMQLSNSGSLFVGRGVGGSGSINDFHPNRIEDYAYAAYIGTTTANVGSAAQWGALKCSGSVKIRTNYDAHSNAHLRLENLDAGAAQIYVEGTDFWVQTDGGGNLNTVNDLNLTAGNKVVINSQGSGDNYIHMRAKAGALISGSTASSFLLLKSGPGTGAGIHTNNIAFQTGSGDGSTHLTTWLLSNTSPNYAAISGLGNVIAFNQQRDKEGAEVQNVGGYSYGYNHLVIGNSGSVYIGKGKPYGGAAYTSMLDFYPTGIEDYAYAAYIGTTDANTGGSLHASGSVKITDGDLSLDSAGTLNVAHTDVAYDMVTGTETFTANGTRGVISLTFDGTLAHGATTGSFVFVNNEIEAQSMVIFQPFSASNHTPFTAVNGGVFGISVGVDKTVATECTFSVNNSSGVIISDDCILYMNYLLVN